MYWCRNDFYWIKLSSWKRNSLKNQLIWFPQFKSIMDNLYNLISYWNSLFSVCVCFHETEKKKLVQEHLWNWWLAWIYIYMREVNVYTIYNFHNYNLIHFCSALCSCFSLSPFSCHKVFFLMSFFHIILSCSA